MIIRGFPIRVVGTIARKERTSMEMPDRDQHRVETQNESLQLHKAIEKAHVVHRCRLQTVTHCANVSNEDEAMGLIFISGSLLSLPGIQV